MPARASAAAISSPAATSPASLAARARKLKVKGRCLTVKVLRAVANVPDGMMKGSVGHGVCDHLTRSVTLSAFCDGANALAREASAILAALAAGDTEAVARAMEDDVRQGMEHIQQSVE